MWQLLDGYQLDSLCHSLPEPALPHFELFPSLLVDALSISVVTLAIHVSLAKIFANKYQYEVDTNQCVLSSIIVVALLGMFRKYEQLKKLWSLSKIDFNVCVLRFDSPLLFTNVQRFRTVVEKLAGDWNGTKFCGNIEKKQLIIEDQNYKAEPTTVLPQDQKRFLIIDCSGFAYVDIMGVNTLKEVHEDLQSRNITVSFAAAKAPVRELFEASGFYKAVAKTNFYPTIYDAILSAQMEQSALSMEAALEENCSAQVATNAAVESKTCKERSHSVQDGEMMRL
uniref:STAS domain-containing protein n=1 Tax=Angiostrongylus cantonensis TaxID=6313 RepID=A0A158P946_ANGCA